MWDRKDHMKIRSVDDFRTALVYPSLLVHRLTAWTAAAAAGTVVDL